MKKKIFGLMAAVCMLGMFSSCSSDDPVPTPKPDPEPEPDPVPAVVPGEDLTAKEYSADALAIVVDGETMTGKIAEFKPATDGTAELTLKGEALNLGEIIAGAMSKADDDALMLPTPGVVPGSPSVTIPLTLTGEADNCEFTGNFTTDFCTFNYSGSVDADNLAFTITDLKLNDQSVAGHYVVPSDFLVDDGWGGEQIDLKRLFRVEWESTKGIEFFPGFEMPVSTILQLALQMVALPDADGEDQPLPILYTKAFKEVDLGEDGSITAKYCDVDQDGWPEETSPKGFASYVVKDDQTILVFLDPIAIIANVTAKASKSRAIDTEAIMTFVINDIIPMCQNGIPVNVGGALLNTGEVDDSYNPVYAPSDDPNCKSFYLGTEVLLPILKVAAPILADDEIIAQIVAAAEKDPNMGYMASMLPNMLKTLPEIVEQTSKVELGINLNKE